MAAESVPEGVLWTHEQYLASARAEVECMEAYAKAGERTKAALCEARALVLLTSAAHLRDIMGEAGLHGFVLRARRDAARIADEITPQWVARAHARRPGAEGGAR